jgi:hypothetical protein
MWGAVQNRLTGGIMHLSLDQEVRPLAGLYIAKENWISSTPRGGRLFRAAARLNRAERHG